MGFQHVLEDLRVEGSPEPVIALAERAVADEHRHAMYQLNCGLACDAIFPNSGNCRQKDYADSGLREILCDCAVIVLR